VFVWLFTCKFLVPPYQNLNITKKNTCSRQIKKFQKHKNTMLQLKCSSNPKPYSCWFPHVCVCKKKKKKEKERKNGQLGIDTWHLRELKMDTWTRLGECWHLWQTNFRRYFVPGNGFTSSPTHHTQQHKPFASLDRVWKAEYNFGLGRASPPPP